MNNLTSVYICPANNCSSQLSFGNPCNRLGQVYGGQYRPCHEIFFDRATEAALGGQAAFRQEFGNYLQMVPLSHCAGNVKNYAIEYLQEEKPTFDDNHTDEVVRNKVFRILLSMMIASDAPRPGTCWTVLVLGGDQLDQLNNGWQNALTGIELRKAGIVSYSIRLPDGTRGFPLANDRNRYVRLIENPDGTYHFEQQILGPQNVVAGSIDMNRRIGH